jgi:RND family efflux transporter MFP subunit
MILLHTRPRFELLCLLLVSGPFVAAAEVPAPVRIAQPETEQIHEALTLTGTVTARRAAALSTRVSGLVVRVEVDAGSRVAAGDALLELDSALARLELERVAAALEEGRIRQAEAERLRSEARRLAADGNVPKSQVDTAEAEVRIAAAAVSRLEAERRLQQEIVARHRLIAPFAGVVSRKLTESGEWVETGTPVLELVAVDDVRVDVQAPQERFDEIEPGSRAEVRTDAVPGRVFAGEVAAIVPVKDPMSRTFLVRVTVPEGARALTPGASALVEFRLVRPRGVMTVARDAVVRQPDGSALVWVVVTQREGTVAAPRRVELGRPVGDAIEIRAGLDGDARVIVRGNETLREGQPVRVLGP